ncbi:MAG TPA: hypothetical protein VM118_09340 [Acidobacteriota bacterium]|nr:hypothetical protein [Acidobacteriota bacterium]
MITADPENQVQSERLPLEGTIHLRGLYITPFGEKEVEASGREAVRGKILRVNFERVIDTVTNFLHGHVEIVGDVGYRFEVTTVRDRVGGKYLDETVMKNIDDADFVVVDWTTSNPNVLWEAGYARGRTKHGIHISADGAFPSDRSGVVYVRYDPEDLDTLPGALQPFMSTFVERIDTNPRVFDYYDERSPDLVRDMIRRSDREICILQTNLDTVNSHHLDDIRKALERGVSVRVLTLDPQSRYVNERAFQLKYDTPSIKFYRAGLQNCIDTAATHLARYKGFRMRLYNDFPNQLTYLFDDRVLACVISRTGRSRDNCAFVLPSSRLRGPRHTFVEHFDQLWQQANQEINAKNWQASWGTVVKEGT